MKPIVIAAAMLGLAAAPAWGQQTPVASISPTATLLNLSVSAEVRRAPDIAHFSAGVTTNAPTAQAAMAENARRMSSVVAALRRAGIAERDIQTAGLNLSPQYVYPDRRDRAAEPEAPRIVGYQASNMVQVRVRKLAEMGRIIDLLVVEGANQVNGPSFMLDNPETALDEARSDAVARARARAELYAKAAGLRVARIISISEQGGYSPPFEPVMVTAARGVAAPPPPPTPVAPGEVTAGVTLSVQFALER